MTYSSPDATVYTDNQYSLFADKVIGFLAADQAPDAFKLLSLNSQFENRLDYRLLSCQVLLKIGRYELCQRVAQGILQSDPANEEAENYLRLISTATHAPVLDASPSLTRSYATSVPQPFLGRLQDAVHHYRYRGIQMVKSPFDMSLYTLMIWNIKPATIIEIGSKEGGSALWMADLARSYGLNSKIYSIDLIRVDSMQDAMITFIQGNGRKLGEVLTPALLEQLPRPWLVIEDADHTEATSSAVLQFFDQWLDKDDFIVIEDGIMSDLYPTAFPGHTSGPHLALKSFLSEADNRYAIDPYYCDFFGYNATWSSNGILKRLAPRASS
jgi:cephalosporin hydroxylase